MRHLFAINVLILCSFLIFGTTTSTGQFYDEWIKQLEKVKGVDPGTERLMRDRLLSKFIKSPTNYNPPSFFERLSHSDLKFYYTRDNSFIHSKWEEVSVDIYPFNDRIQVRFWDESLDINEARQCGVVQMGGEYVVRATWLNLDSDSDLEFICISRSGGTGPYYHGIIIDSSYDMFSFRVFYSGGRPRIDSKKRVIGIGKLKDGYQGALTEIVYTDYIWNNGLKLAKTVDNKE